ncbi:MAG: hypothetical protein KDD29_04365 [Flavobacteriales bacterium]|nr:hypothetical protein [Flavobacteriales bacterium]MCB9335758.1 hypothetical protein [Flavobacteriales bacterium]
MKPLTKYTITIVLLIVFNIANAFNPNLPKGIVYQISLNSLDLQKSQAVIEEYHYLTNIIKDRSSTYVFGKYSSFSEVDSVKTLLEKNGCLNPQIIAYHDQMEISVADAISIQYKSNMITAESIEERKESKKISVQEVNYLLDVQKSGLKHYYALAIPVNSIETVDKLLEQLDNEQVIEISSDDDIFSIGRFENFEDVLKARKKFIDGEINDVFVMAQITDERIEIDDTQNFAVTIQNLVNNLAEK